jgi:hypothetical protein
LTEQGDGVDFAPTAEGLWSVDRYLSLITGELPRCVMMQPATGLAAAILSPMLIFPRR